MEATILLNPASGSGVEPWMDIGLCIGVLLWPLLQSSNTGSMSSGLTRTVLDPSEIVGLSPHLPSKYHRSPYKKSPT